MLLVALLLAVQVVRNAAVAALAAGAPQAALRIWPGHPAAELALARADIDRAARGQKRLSPSTIAMVADAASKAPLAPEPFLARGVEQRLAGNNEVAVQSFLAAERRDPGSPAARYFLADLYYHGDDAGRALKEIAALARLAPGGVQATIPYIAVYTKDRSTWPTLRAMFGSNPALEDAALTALASDPANADVVLALADPRHVASHSRWPGSLVNSLIAAREYRRARTIWRQAWRVQDPAGATLYDAQFRDSLAPAPFNWDLISSSVGVAKRQTGGRLHLVYYGHGDGVLARQLLMLAPGTYHLTLAIKGDLAKARAISWSVRCDKTPFRFASSSLDRVASQGWKFTVPTACAAQWLELSAKSAGVQQRSDFAITDLRLAREEVGT